MQRFFLPILLLMSALLEIHAASAAQDPDRSFQQVMERILVQYPSLKVAQYQVARARQEIAKVESQLGWSLAGNGGVTHDVSVFGTPSDLGDINVSLQRKLESGHSVGISGNYTYEDNSFTFSPQFPNPSHATELDLNYRIPLAKGEDNADYYEGLAGAKAGIKIERARAEEVRNSIANQALDLFYAKALTEARLENAQQAVDNAQRLKAYIKHRSELGLAEEKDRLQAEAQLQAQQTTLKQLDVVLEKQRITLNRLMGESWQANYISLVTTNSRLLEQGIDELIRQAEQTYPPLQQYLGQLELTESVLQRSRDQRKDTMDLVLSVGTRTRTGDSTTGSVDESDVAGRLRFEYSASLDKSGLDAEVRQAQLDRTIAMEEIRRVKDDLNYDLASLVQEINAAKQAVISARQHLQSEREKFEEALQRYRQGRTDTDRLIQFENERNTAKLNLAQQKIELAKRIDALEILHGIFWQNMTARTTVP